jgi:hypothetical protein
MNRVKSNLVKDVNENYPIYKTLKNELIRGTNQIPSHIRNKDSAFDYYFIDLQAVNLASTLTVPQPLTFTNQRDVPFLSAPANEFEVSIVRFQLDTSSLPVWIPTIQPASTSATQTIYSFTLSVTIGGILYENQTFLDWQPQNLYAIQPQPPSANVPQLQDNSTGYYNTLSYEWVVYLFQQTFNACFTQLNNAVVAGGGVLPTTNPPVIVYSVDTNLMTIYADQAGYDPTVNTTDCIGIYFNAPMFGLMESFLATYLGPNQANGKNFQLQVFSFNGTNLTYLPTIGITQVPAVGITQTYTTVGIWNPVESINFTTNTIPINSTSILPSQVYFEGVNVGPQSGNSNIANIITSFQSPNQIYRPSISYQPSVYRFVSLMGEEQLKLFQINCYWKDYLGQFNPFLLASSQTFSMLVMFKKRQAY